MFEFIFGGIVGAVIFFIGYLLGLKHGKTEDIELLEQIACKMRDEVDSCLARFSGVKRP